MHQPILEPLQEWKPLLTDSEPTDREDMQISCQNIPIKKLCFMGWNAVRTMWIEHPEDMHQIRLRHGLAVAMLTSYRHGGIVTESSRSEIVELLCAILEYRSREAEEFVNRILEKTCPN